MGATFSRIKNWITEVLTYADLNAEIDNLLTNFTFAGLDDYSTNTTQMRLTTDPGESGTESLATAGTGELERLRFTIKEMKGSEVDYWYESAPTSLSELASALGSTLLANRIASGRMRTGSSQPLFLVPPSGGTKVVTLKGATTPFVYFINSTSYTISTDVTLTSLTAAPSSNNTTLVNLPGLAAESWTAVLGEFGSTIQVDAMGSEISALVGKLAGFKISGASTEYCLARVDSTTQLSNIKRGLFFDSTDAPISRSALSDNTTITLMKLTWIFANTGGTLAAAYTNPTFSSDEPTSPSIGDYWYDTANSTWKQFNVSSVWVTAGATLVGCCLQDTTDTVAARSFDFFKNFSELCTARIERTSATACITANQDTEMSIYGTGLKFNPGRMTWSTATDFDSGVTEAASTLYFLYVKESGDVVISNVIPYDRTADLKGLYHPYHTWRCVGSVYNNGSSDFVACIDYQDESPTNYKVTTQVASSALTFNVFANPLSRIPINLHNTTEIAGYIRIPCRINCVIPSSATLGHKSTLASPIHLYLMNHLGTPYIGVATAPFDAAVAASSTVISAGATSLAAMYSIGALSAVPIARIASMSSTQTTAGTWATVPTLLAQSPSKARKAFAFYTTNTAQTMANGAATRVDFEDRVTDTLQCVTTGASWVFTAPFAGKLNVHCCVQVGAGGAWEVAEYLIMQIFVNGGANYTIGDFQSQVTTSANNAWICKGSIEINAAAADAFSIHLIQNHGSGINTSADATYNWVSMSLEPFNED